MNPPPLICHRDKRKWSCELGRDWSVVVPRLKGRGTYFFRTEKDGRLCQEWLKLDRDGTVTLRAGYASDGCSMVPDFPEALPGCVLHDALRQATRLDPDCPWSRAEADIIFREAMQESGFSFLGRWIYYLGVAGPTGWIYTKLKALFAPPTDTVCG